MISAELATVGRRVLQQNLLSSSSSPDTLKNIQAKVSPCVSLSPSTEPPLPTEEWEHRHDLSPTCKGGNIVRDVTAALPLKQAPFEHPSLFIFCCYNKIPEMLLKEKNTLFWLTALEPWKS